MARHGEVPPETFLERVPGGPENSVLQLECRVTGEDGWKRLHADRQRADWMGYCFPVFEIRSHNNKERDRGSGVVACTCKDDTQATILAE